MCKRRQEFVFATIGFAQRLFSFFLFGDVARKAARVNKLSIVEQDARVDQNIEDASIFAPHLGRIILQDFTEGESLENVVYNRLTDMKLAYVSSDIFITAVAEELELRLIDP